MENWLDLQAQSISVTACAKQCTSGLVAGAALSNIFISDLGDGAECPLSTFMCDIRLGETGYCRENRAAIQRDLINLEEWASKDYVMAKAVAVLHTGWGCHSGSIWPGGTSAEEDWQVLRGRSVSQQCVLLTLTSCCRAK